MVRCYVRSVYQKISLVIVEMSSVGTVGATTDVGALDTSVHVVRVLTQWAAVDENGLTKLGVGRLSPSRPGLPTSHNSHAPADARTRRVDGPIGAAPGHRSRP